LSVKYFFKNPVTGVNISDISSMYFGVEYLLGEHQLLVFASERIKGNYNTVAAYALQVVLT